MARSTFLAIMIVSLGVALAQQSGSGGRVPVPPLQNGGIAGLWYNEHKFILDEYGEFELLNYDNCGFPVAKDSIARSTWKLTAMGNFTGGELRYATLARIKNRSDGVLLVMFGWADPSDSTIEHGVFHHTFIAKESLLVRTKQASVGQIDTLEFSCADLNRVCGKAYYNESGGYVSLAIVDVDRKVPAGTIVVGDDTPPDTGTGKPPEHAPATGAASPAK